MRHLVSRPMLETSIAKALTIRKTFHKYTQVPIGLRTNHTLLYLGAATSAGECLYVIWEFNRLLFVKPRGTEG